MASHNDVAHAWAHKLNRHFKGFNMFRGHSSGYGAPTEEYDTIYSYGYHFPIARHAKTANGTPCILLTTEGYSVSTSKHITYVQRALPSGVLVFKVKNVLATTKAHHKENYEAMKKTMIRSLESAARARKHVEMWLNSADYTRRSMNTYTNMFKLGYRQITAEPLAGAMVKARDVLGLTYTT